MGLLTGLLTLPLAPVRGTIWIAEQVAAVAEQELDVGARAQRRLLEAEMDFEAGRIGEDEYERIEDEVLEQLQETEGGA